MDSDSGRDVGLGMDHVAGMALTLLLGGSVVALVGQHTAAQAGPAIVLSLLLAALGAMPMLYCLHVLDQRLPRAGGLQGALRIGWGSRPARLMGWALLLELLATSAGVAWSTVDHVHAALATCGLDAGVGLPGQAVAAAGLLLLGMVTLLPARRVALMACGLLTVKVGVGLLLLALAARHVHYAHWVPWLPEATAPYRFGIGGVLAASVPLLGVFASVGLVLGLPQPRQQARPRQPLVLARVVLIAMLSLIVLAAVQAGLVEFPVLASTRPLSMALQGHPQLQWMLPLLPLGGAAGLMALQLVLLQLGAQLATQLWPTGWGTAPGLWLRLRGIVLVLLAMPLVLWVPPAALPVLPGPVTLLVMAALCLAALRAPAPIPRGMPVLAPLAVVLCLLAAAERLRAWPG